MTLQIPAFAEDQSYAFSYLRMMLASLATPGVINSGDLLVTPLSGLQVQISAGKGFVQQTVAALGSFYNGMYEVFNDAAANPYNQLASPTSNSRVDRVVARVYDPSEQGLPGSSYARFEWVQGTESAGTNLSTLAGIAPLPANSLGLANVLRTVGEVSLNNILNVATVVGAGSQLDTGWVPLSLAPGVTGINTAKIRVVGDLVTVRGFVTLSTPVAQFANIWTFPVSISPAVGDSGTIACPAIISGTRQVVSGAVSRSTFGSIATTQVALSSGDSFYIDNHTWRTT